MELKTSKEWLELEFKQGEDILDPDGWDRENFAYSFEEERITKQEFWKRVCRSTCCIHWKERIINHELPG